MIDAPRKESTRLDGSQRARCGVIECHRLHVHLVVRGVAEDGSDLVVTRDYISHGLRSRPEDLVAAELSRRPHGQANGWSVSRPNAPCAISSCGRHHQDHAPSLHRTWSGSRHRRLCN
jgi:hypothetical protein